MTGHPGSHKHHGNENGDRGYQIGDIGNEIKHIKRDFLRRQVMLDDIVILFSDLDDTDDRYKNQYDKDVGSQEFLNYEFIEDLHYSRTVIFLSIISFHAKNVPFFIRLRASRISQ